jgi:hypothetical protein
MDYGTPSITSQIAEASPAESEIELLVRETRAPRELVRKLYATERERLEKSAKIKTYVPVLIRRSVKTLLQKQRRA